jgi:hypothetical protein
MRAFTSKMVAFLAVVAAAGWSSGCATTPSVAYDLDEPEQRLAAIADGMVMRVDEPHGIVVLDNGRMYRVSGERAVLVNGQPVVLSRLQPGTRVTIVSGTPVVYQDGRYVTVAPGASTVVTAPPGTVVAPPPGTVVPAPPGTVTVPAPVVAGSTIRMQGRVSDIESNGNVKVRLPDGNAFEFRPPAGTVARKGDPVTIDMTFGAAQPSALPR